MHSLITIPQQEGPADWAYGQRVWFFDDRHTTFTNDLLYALHRTKGVFHAMFWPSPGVVEISRGPDLFSHLAETEGAAYRSWTIQLSPAGFEALRGYLADSRREGPALYDDGATLDYLSTQRYHMFHTCHHYIAYGLVRAGVPISAWRCWQPYGLWSQLNRLSSRYDHAVQARDFEPARPSADGSNPKYM